jgi:hypothetical protein
MTKAAKALDLPLGDRRPSEKIWRWLYDEIRDAILSGRLQGQDPRMPSPRRLVQPFSAADLVVVH